MIKNAIEHITDNIYCLLNCLYTFNYKVRFYMSAGVSFFFIPNGKGQTTSGIKKVNKCNCTYPFPFLVIIVHSINRLVFYFGSLWACSIYVWMNIVPGKVEFLSCQERHSAKSANSQPFLSSLLEVMEEGLVVISWEFQSAWKRIGRKKSIEYSMRTLHMLQSISQYTVCNYQ